MISTSTYHVFGSGDCGVDWFVPPSISVAEYKALRAAVLASETDQGHNGFIGTRGVPDDFPMRGVVPKVWANPPGGGAKCPEGLVPAPFLRHLKNLDDTLPMGDEQVRYRYSHGMPDSQIDFSHA